jgi:hypothetical protein
MLQDKKATQRTDSHFLQLYSQQLLEGTCLLHIKAIGLPHKRFMGLQDSVSKVSVEL